MLTEWFYEVAYVILRTAKTQNDVFMIVEFVSYWMSRLFFYFENIIIYFAKLANMYTTVSTVAFTASCGTVCLIPVITTCLRSLDQMISSREWGQFYTRRGAKLYTPTAEFQAHDCVVMERKLTHDNTSDQISSSKTFVWKSRSTYISIHSRVSSTTHIPEKKSKS